MTNQAACNERNLRKVRTVFGHDERKLSIVFDDSIGENGGASIVRNGVQDAVNRGCGESVNLADAFQGFIDANGYRLTCRPLPCPEERRLAQILNVQAGGFSSTSLSKNSVSDIS